MAVPARIKTWSSGETVSASDLNTEFNIAINALTDGSADLTILSLTAGSITVSGAATFNGAMTLGNALADIITITGQVKADEIAFAGIESPGFISNLGLSLSAGVMTIHGSEGTAFSSTNRGYVCMNGATAGQTEIIKITANATMRDDNHASSDLTNIGFGITETAHWAQDVPFFLYVVNRNDADIDGSDGNSCFALARNPAMTVTPSDANKICDTDAGPVTDGQTTIMLLGSFTEANYTSKPCQLIGAIRMQWSTTSDDWTVQTIGNNDGFGQTQVEKTLGTLWTYPTGQDGADTGTHWKANGGTAPVFTTQNFTYMINRAGIVECFVNVTGDGGTDGAGAVTAQLSLPYAVGGHTYIGSFSSIWLNCAGAATQFAMLECVFDQTHADLFIAAGTNVTNANFSNGGRTVDATFRYKAF